MTDGCIYQRMLDDECFDYLAIAAIADSFEDAFSSAQLDREVNVRLYDGKYFKEACDLVDAALSTLIDYGLAVIVID